MSHRTQVALSDTQYRRLLTESEQSGLSLAGLVRRAVDNCYGQPAPEEVVRALRASFGSWQDRDFDGESYVEAMRPGLGRGFARFPDRS